MSDELLIAEPTSPQVLPEPSIQERVTQLEAEFAQMTAKVQELEAVIAQLKAP